MICLSGSCLPHSLKVAFAVTQHKVLLCACTEGGSFVPDGVVVQDIDEEITIENDEVFHPTSMWQEIKPGE